MLDMRKKATNISADPRQHLEIEWNGQFILLKLPMRFDREGVRLATMSPRTAYNLYKWLENNLETIKALAGVVDEQD